MLYIYVIILALSLLSGLAMLWHVPMLTENREQLKKRNKHVSIIIPARNEEKNLPILLDSLRKQTYQPLEILVIDDHSQDQTALLAKKYGAEVIQFKADKSGWVGKSAACWYGAQAAAGHWLLFLDADIFFPETDSLLRIINHFQEEGVLSIQPYHIVHHLYENLSTVFNIMVLTGMNYFSVLGNRLRPAGAFGPSLLCTRSAYFQVGGHKKVRDSIMENVALGKYFQEHDFPVSLFSGKHTLHFRMYPDGIGSLSEGWAKSFASGSVATHPFLLICTSFWITGALTTFFYLIVAALLGNPFELLVAFVGYLLYFLLFFRMARKSGRFYWFALFCYPVLFIYFVFLFGWSALQTFVFKSVSWKGRKIKL